MFDNRYFFITRGLLEPNPLNTRYSPKFHKTTCVSQNGVNKGAIAVNNYVDTMLKLIKSSNGKLNMIEEMS